MQRMTLISAAVSGQIWMAQTGMAQPHGLQAPGLEPAAASGPVHRPASALPIRRAAVAAPIGATQLAAPIARPVLEAPIQSQAQSAALQRPAPMQLPVALPVPPPDMAPEPVSFSFDNVHFAHDEARLLPSAEGDIARIAALLQAAPERRWIVEGHTDDRGSAAYNLGLSQRRAEAVIAALTGRHGIARDRLEPRGLGESRPIASNADEAGRQRNRRVVMLER